MLAYLSEKMKNYKDYVLVDDPVTACKNTLCDHINSQEI